MKRISILLLSLAFVGGCITVRLIFFKTNSTLQPPISPKAPASGGKSSEAIDVPSSTLGGLAKLKTGGDVVPGAFIEIRRSAGRTYGAVVDKDGRYAFGYVEPGTYQVFGKLHSNGRSFPLAILQIKAGESLSQDLFFPLGPSISGKIVPWDQKMLKEAEMIIKNVGGDEDREHGHCIVQGENQIRYIIETAHGEATVSVHSEGYLTSKPLSLQIGEINITGLEFRLENGGAQGGLVVNERQQLIPKATVILTHQSFPEVPLQSAVTNETGQFDFPALPAGTYVCVVKATGYVVEQLKESIEINLGQRNSPITLTLREGWRLTGQVVDSLDRPIAKAKIEAKEGTRTTRAYSNADGTFVLGGINPNDPEHQLEPGIDSLLCQAKGYPTLRLKNVPPGANLKLVLPLPGSLEVSVKLSDGQITPDFTWSAWLKSEKLVDEVTGLSVQPVWEANPCQGPISVIKGLAPGSYEFAVRAPGREAYSLPLISIRSGEKTNIEAILNRGGEGDLGVASLSLNNSADLRRQLQSLIKDLSATDREDILNGLKARAKTYPEHSDKRKIIEDALDGLRTDK